MNDPLLSKEHFQNSTTTAAPTTQAIINDDILNINVKKLYKDRFIVFGNLPYNISTEILAKWILNLNDKNFAYTL